jgi:hypothetical protein
MGDADTIKDIISEVDTDNVSLRVVSTFSCLFLSFLDGGLVAKFPGREDQL